MVLGSKLEVSQCHSNESSNYQENDEDDKQDAVYGVNPMTPDASKDIIKLNIYCTERQKSCHCHLRDCLPVPWQRWNLPGIFGGAARSLELSLSVLSSNPTQHQQRWRHQRPYQNYNHNCAEWKSSSGRVSNCNGIQKAECKQKRPTKEAPRQQ